MHSMSSSNPKLSCPFFAMEESCDTYTKHRNSMTIILWLLLQDLQRSWIYICKTDINGLEGFLKLLLEAVFQCSSVFQATLKCLLQIADYHCFSVCCHRLEIKFIERRVNYMFPSFFFPKANQRSVCMQEEHRKLFLASAFALKELLFSIGFPVQLASTVPNAAWWNRSRLLSPPMSVRLFQKETLTSSKS